MSGGVAEDAGLAELAAETGRIADLGVHAELVTAILGAARRAGIDGRITIALCAALASLGATPLEVYGIGRGPGPRYDYDHELRADAAETAASFRDTAARLAEIITAAETGRDRARAIEAAAEIAVTFARQLPPGTPGGHLQTARNTQWAAAVQAAQAEEILASAIAAREALTFAAGQLEQVGDLLAEVYEPLYEIKARPGGRLPGDGAFITGRDPGEYGQVSGVSLR